MRTTVPALHPFQTPADPSGFVSDAVHQTVDHTLIHAVPQHRGGTSDKRMDYRGIVNLIDEVFVVDHFIEPAEGAGDLSGEFRLHDIHVVRKGDTAQAKGDRYVGYGHVLRTFGQRKDAFQDLRHIEEKAAENRKEGTNHQRALNGYRRFM